MTEEALALATQAVKEVGAKHSGAIQLGSDDLFSEVKGYISTGNPMIDYMIGAPGIPSGRLTTIIGEEGAGKSTLALALLRETQRIGGIGILADTENRLWTPRAEGLGLDMHALIRLTPDTLEECMSEIESMIDFLRDNNKTIPVTIAVDSIAGSPTKADLAGKYGDSIPASHARLLSFAMRRIHKKISAQRIALVFVNQLRHKLEFGSFGPPKMVMLGEKTLNYWASLKIMMAQGPLIGEKTDPTGALIRMHVLDSRISPRKKWMRAVNLDFLKGFDEVDSALDVLVEIEAIEKNSNGRFSFEGGKSWFRKDFPAFRAEHPEMDKFLEAAPTLWRKGHEAEANPDE